MYAAEANANALIRWERFTVAIQVPGRDVCNRSRQPALEPLRAECRGKLRSSNLDDPRQKLDAAVDVWWRRNGLEDRREAIIDR